MRVQSFLSFGLFGLRATAVPSLSLRQTNEEIKEEIDKQIGDLEPGCLIVFEPEREMCTNNKTPKMWKDLGIGPWLQVVTIGMHPFQTGLYESIRDRNKKLHDIKCGDVISPDGLSSL
jgi:hypothetical protein